jgi:hypothetical protein
MSLADALIAIGGFFVKRVRLYLHEIGASFDPAWLFRPA